MNKRNRIYWPNCSVCQYMKKHPDFKRAVLYSTYLDPNGKESLMDVYKRYKCEDKFKSITLYKHMQNHQKKDIERSERLAKLSGKESKVWQRSTVKVQQAQEKKTEKTEVQEVIESTVKLIEEDNYPKKRYEVGLDEFIELGRDRLSHNEMTISAANYIAAIKVKAELDSKRGDRKLEMLRSMFAGAAPQNKEIEGGSSGSH